MDDDDPLPWTWILVPVLLAAALTVLFTVCIVPLCHNRDAFDENREQLALEEAPDRDVRGAGDSEHDQLPNYHSLAPTVNRWGWIRSAGAAGRRRREEGLDARGEAPPPYEMEAAYEMEACKGGGEASLPASLPAPLPAAHVRAPSRARPSRSLHADPTMPIVLSLTAASVAATTTLTCL